MRNILLRWWLCLIVALTCMLHMAYATGGEKATLSTPPYSSLNTSTHRQDVCHRYHLFRDGKIELRHALSGLALHPLMGMGDFFHYTDEDGIDPVDPGLMASLLDALAESANFTWRESFALMQEPETINQTWTHMLLWGINNYDIAINWFDQSVNRMEKGAAYVEPWFDGSLILVDQQDPPIDNDTIVWFNWMSPFEPSVWALIVFTIVMSAMVFQFIEYMNDARDDRPFNQWVSDNLYLSSMNFTQNFEYAPNSFGGRIFGVSMGMWALVMSATYTANLASLFVQDSKIPLVVESIDQAILLEIPICVWGGTNSEVILQQRYPNAIQVAKASELETFQALRRGECGLVVAYKDNWEGFKGRTLYNPECDLEWVGRVVSVIKSGFAVKADAGFLCSSLIRDVLNLHMVELINNGFLEKFWETHRAQLKDQECAPTTDLDDLQQRYRRRLVNSGHIGYDANMKARRQRQTIED